MTATQYLMTISSTGQIALPADTLERWNAHEVTVVDLGDRLVVQPVFEESVDDLIQELQS